MHGSWLRYTLTAVFAAGVFAGPVTASAQQSSQIGVAAAINPNAEGTPPQAETRTLRVGVNIQANERIVTSADGQAQMLFLDESAFTVGPNSDIVLDEFVFDPNTGTGRIALSAAKGVFRMVGGKISKRTPVTLKTPTAVIGIRGGIALVNVADNGATQATFLFGEQMTVDTGAGQQSVNRPGFTVSADSADAPPSPPAPASNEQLTGSLTSLEGSAPPPADGDGESAGGGQVPTNQRVAGSNISALGSNNSPSALSAPPPAPAGPAGPAQGGSTAEDTTTESQQNTVLQDSENLGITVNGLSGRFRQSTARANGGNDGQSPADQAFTSAAISGGIFSATLGSSTLRFPVTGTGTTSFTGSATSSPFGPFSGSVFLSTDQRFLFTEGQDDSNTTERTVTFAGIPTTSSQVPTSGVTYYALQNDYLLDTSIPFFRATEVSGLTPPESESLADTAIYWDVSGSSTAQRSFGHRTIVISGQGTNQKSAVSLIGGVVRLDSNNRPFIEGGVFGSSRLVTSTSNASFQVSSEAASVDDGNGNDFFGSSANYFVLDSADVNSSDVISNRGAEVLLSNNATATYNPLNVALPATETLGSRTTRQMYGYNGGAYQTLNSSGAVQATILFQPLNSATASTDIRTSATTNKVKADFKFTNTFMTDTEFTVGFGDLDSAFGDGSATNGDSVFIDDFTIAAADRDSAASVNTGPSISNTDIAFISVSDADEFDSGFIPSGVTLCSCEFLNWGFWSGRIDRSDNTKQIVHLANYVTGVIPQASSISGLTGTASYSGHAIGTVVNNSNIYQAIGNLTVTVDFGSPSSSSFQISNFDGGTYASSGGISLTSDGAGRNQFSASITGQSGTAVGRSGSVLGSFMQGGSDVTKEMGGHFKASGTGYQTSGVFAGAKQ